MGKDATIFYSLEGIAKKLKIPTSMRSDGREGTIATSSGGQRLCLFHAATLLSLVHTRKDGTKGEYKCFHSSDTCKGVHVKSVSDLSDPPEGQRLLAAAYSHPLKALITGALITPKTKGRSALTQSRSQLGKSELKVK